MSMQKNKSILVAAHFESVLFTIDFLEEKGNWTCAEVSFIKNFKIFYSPDFKWLTGAIRAV